MKWIRQYIGAGWDVGLCASSGGGEAQRTCAVPLWDAVGRSVRKQQRCEWCPEEVSVVSELW